MFKHLIALAKFGDDFLAYHYSSTHKSEFLIAQQSLKEAIEPLGGAVSIHVLKTDEASFDSVQQMDPYFLHARVYEDKAEFVNAVKATMQLTDLDIAAYLIQQDVTKAFSLHKTLYYLYADYLVKWKKSLFDANFVAFEHGPVDRRVYAKNKYEQAALSQQYGLETKLAFYQDSTAIYQFLDNGIQKYGSYFTSSLWDKQENPTHRVGTPWSIARLRKPHNSSISDEDILKFHYLESIGRISQ